jgi:hypothetical protein
LGRARSGRRRGGAPAPLCRHDGAENHLFLSRALTRHWRGRARKLDPSPFLRAIEAALVQHQQAEVPRRRAEDRQLDLF